MTREKITAIDEFKGEAPQYGSEAGFKITTTEQQITLAIDDDPSCCEEWGYLLSEDDIGKFIGAELRGIAVTDTNRTKRVISREYSGGEDDVCLDSGEAMFIDIETDRGVLQFAAYNAHNGYYGHDARIESKQLTLEKAL